MLIASYRKHFRRLAFTGLNARLNYKEKALLREAQL